MLIAIVAAALLIAISAGQTAYLWDGRHRPVIIEKRDCFTERVASSPDGSLIAIGWDDGVVDLRTVPRAGVVFRQPSSTGGR